MMYGELCGDGDVRLLRESEIAFDFYSIVSRDRTTRIIVSRSHAILCFTNAPPFVINNKYIALAIVENAKKRYCSFDIFHKKKPLRIFFF